MCCPVSDPKARQIEQGQTEHGIQSSKELPRSRNHKAPFSSKHNHVRIDGETHNGSRPALTASGVNGRDEITERQALLPIGFHDMYLPFA